MEKGPPCQDNIVTKNLTKNGIDIPGQPSYTRTAESSLGTVQRAGIRPEAAQFR